jgi:hypothetical protein
MPAGHPGQNGTWNNFSNCIGGQAWNTLSGSMLKDVMSVLKESPPFIHAAPFSP